MGKLRDVRRFKDAVVNKARNPDELAGDLKNIKDSAKAAVADSEARVDFGKRLLSSAMDEAGMRREDGSFSRLRTVRALARPPVLAKDVAKGLAKGVIGQVSDHQGRHSDRDFESDLEQ